MSYFYVDKKIAMWSMQCQATHLDAVDDKRSEMRRGGQTDVESWGDMARRGGKRDTAVHCQAWVVRQGEAMSRRELEKGLLLERAYAT